MNFHTVSLWLTFAIVLLKLQFEFFAIWNKGYVTTILDDARAFSNHAGKKSVDADDIKIAIKSKVDYSFTNTPSKEVLKWFAFFNETLKHGISFEKAAHGNKQNKK